MHGRYEKQKSGRPSGKKKVVLIVLAVILIVVVALAIAGAVYYNAMLNRLNIVEVPKVVYTQPTQQPQETTTPATDGTTVATTEPHVASSADYINFLVVGQASRDGEDYRMADTMMLFSLNTYTKTLTRISFLRDAFVKPTESYKGHTFGRIKLTNVYHLGSLYGDGVAGSMELINMTLYNNFGVEVDYNFEIDFEAFVKIVNLLDGVEIEITQAEADYLNNDGKVWQEGIKAGLCWMDGDTALAYARMRKAEGDNESDIVRTERQRKFVEAIFNQVKDLSLSQLQTLAEELLPMITTSMSKTEITQMLVNLLPMLPELTMVNGGTCPADYWGDTVDIYGDGVFHSVLRFDQAETTKAMRALTEGETS